MKIETKFNVGDTIWEIEERGERVQCECCKRSWRTENPAWEVLPRPLLIASINIRISAQPDRGNVIYHDAHDVGYGIAFEEDSFPTQEEAQAECDRRNAERKGDDNV